MLLSMICFLYELLVGKEGYMSFSMACPTGNYNNIINSNGLSVPSSRKKSHPRLFLTNLLVHTGEFYGLI